MSKEKHSPSHIRNTFAILSAYQSHEKVMLSSEFCKAKCSTTIVSLLYNRMLTRVLSSTRSYNHAFIRLPDKVYGKLGTIKNFEEWFLANKYQTDMNSADLLNIGALSGWHAAWRFLISSGLIRVNGINRIVLEYPIDGKFYSIEYAGNVMRGLLKKNTDKKDTVERKEESSDTGEESHLRANFWDEE